MENNTIQQQEPVYNENSLCVSIEDNFGYWSDEAASFRTLMAEIKRLEKEAKGAATLKAKVEELTEALRDAENQLENYIQGQ